MAFYPLTMMSQPISPPTPPFSVVTNILGSWHRAPHLFNGPVHAQQFAAGIGHKYGCRNGVKGGVQHMPLSLSGFGRNDGFLAADLQRCQGIDSRRHIDPAGNQCRDAAIARAQRSHLKVDGDGMP